jgi:uncharacterized protein (DUF885 family)
MDVRFVLILLSAAFVVSGCGRQSEPTASSQAAPPAAAMDEWQAFTNRFIEEFLARRPEFAVDAGRHEFDGQLGDWSAEGIAKEVQALRAARDEAERFMSDALTDEQRFERDYLFAVIDKELFWLDRARAPFTNPTWYIYKLDPQVYLTREYAPLEKRMAAYIDYARAIPRVAEDIRANLRTPMPKSFVERGISGFGGFAAFFRDDVPKVFEPVKNADLQKQFREANAAAVKAMEGLKSWLESQRATATDDFALGEQMFMDMVRLTEGVDMSITELAAAGRADLERNLAALREACAQLLPKAPIPRCIDKMTANKPEAGAVEAARAQLVELKAFLEKNEVVTIPGTEEALVMEAPPYNRANFAYINIPGPYEKGMPSTYYVAPPDPSWSPAERAAYIPGKADLLYTSVHEVWPGHFLQFLHSNRHPSKLASLFVGYAFAEGWAHYTEEMMWEMGLGDGDAEQRVGQLTNALLRNVRYLSAIGLHAQGMTLEESEQMFRESAFADPGNARQQAARGTYDPAYLNYTLGKLMIRKLRDDWVARQPGSSGDPRKLWREFHDRFLSYGGPPIPLVRRQMLPGDTGPLM